MKNFLRKLLGVYELESHVLRLSAETSKLQTALEVMQSRHTKLQSQMVTYALQQRRKEAAYDIQCVTVSNLPDNFQELFDHSMGKPAASLADTFSDTITERALAALKVSDPLPVCHPAVEAQEARNKRYSASTTSDENQQ